MDNNSLNNHFLSPKIKLSHPIQINIIISKGLTFSLATQIHQKTLANSYAVNKIPNLIKNVDAAHVFNNLIFHLI